MGRLAWRRGRSRAPFRPWRGGASVSCTPPGSGKFGMLPPTGTVGDSYGNAMTGGADGACRTELVWRRKPFRDLRDLELATFRWVSRRKRRTGCTGPWAAGHWKRWKPSIMQTKRRKPPHYKSGTKIRPYHRIACLNIS